MNTLAVVLRYLCLFSGGTTLALWSLMSKRPEYRPAFRACSAVAILSGVIAALLLWRGR